MLFFDNILKFTKGHILRIRPKTISLQNKTIEDESKPDKVFFAPGEYIKATVYLPYFMCLYPPEDFDYQFEQEKIVKTSHEKKMLSPKENQRSLFGSNLFRRKEQTTTLFTVLVPCTVETAFLAKGESQFSCLMNVLLECSQKSNISVIKFFVDSQFCNSEEYGDFENVEKHIEPVLEKIQLSIPYLIISVADSNPTPFLQNVDFQHLAVYSTFSTKLPEKVLSCGFLYLNAPIINIEVLRKFNGFGLVLREHLESKIGHDTVIEEIEKWKLTSSSKREIFGVLRKEVMKNKNDGSFTDYQEVCTKYTYLFPGRKPFYLESMKIIPLDDIKPAALIVYNSRGYIGVYFVNGSWEKWENVLRLTQNTRE